MKILIEFIIFHKNLGLHENARFNFVHYILCTKFFLHEFYKYTFTKCTKPYNSPFFRRVINDDLPLYFKICVHSQTTGYLSPNLDMQSPYNIFFSLRDKYQDSNVKDV